MKFKMKINSRVREFREELDLTQEELGNRIGVSRQTIYYLEKGDYNPTLTLTFKLSEIFHKNIEEIFFQAPVLKDIIGDTSGNILKAISEKLDITIDELLKLGDLSDEELSEKYKRDDLEILANELNLDFKDLFLE